MNETNTQIAPAAQPTPAPAPEGNMTAAGLSNLVNKRNASRASAAAKPPGSNAKDATPANGSAASPDPASSQPAAEEGRRRTDDSELGAKDGQGEPTEQDPAAGTEEGAESEGEPAENEDGKPGKRTERRIGKLVAKLKQAEAEIARLRQPGGPAAAPPQQQAPDHGEASSKFGHVPAVDALNSRIAEITAALRWLQANPEGGEVSVGDRKFEFTPKQVQQHLADGQMLYSDLVAQRANAERDARGEYDRRQAEARITAATAYPWLSNDEAPEFKEAVTYLQSLPPHVAKALEALPDSRLILGDLIAGRRARAAANGTAKLKTTPAVPRPTPQPTSGGNAAARVAPEQADAKEKASKFESSGRTADFRETLAARRRAAREAVA